ncbi:MAG: hypothetical protein F9K29_22880 [Hyphomicrobiaceae bacterium]|nr:MAG: hypothetical protein F9K29_22880 [Hyphomicrobiaceae bacterium]
MHSITERAETAIGRDDAGADWQLRPQEHARTLPAEAAPLKRVLERAELQEIMQRFRSADAAASSAQARYKRVGRAGLYAATIATLAGALFLLPLEAWLAGPAGAATSAVQILALATAFLASRLLALAKPFDAWMKQRAEAEIARVGLFDAIAHANEGNSAAELPFLPLMLAYFQRYQLGVQRRYYRERGAQHAAAVWRNNRWLSASMWLTALSLAIAIAAGLHVAAAFGLPLPRQLAAWSAAIPRPDAHRVVLALGVIASGLYGLGVARSLMDLDERNASRYLTTADNLDYLVETGLQHARDAAAAGNAEPVLAFIAQMQELISAEHQEWVLFRERGPKPPPRNMAGPALPGR